MTRFRPCIDLHNGQVKQIVGGTLSEDGKGLKTNFVSDRPAAWYAALYRQDNLVGGHVIRLGQGNDEPCLEALKAYPGGLQVGGGIQLDNAIGLLDAGASHVIVTSWLFPNARLNWPRLEALSAHVGSKRLVLDLSCRRQGESWAVAINRWQTITDCILSPALLARMAPFAAEFLVHAADVEGKCEGIDEPLVRFLGSHSPLPVTYAGGASSLEDLTLVAEASNGRVDLTIGSALDIFGGQGVLYADCLAFNRAAQDPWKT